MHIEFVGYGTDQEFREFEEALLKAAGGEGQIRHYRVFEYTGNEGVLFNKKFFEILYQCDRFTFANRLLKNPIARVFLRLFFRIRGLKLPPAWGHWQNLRVSVVGIREDAKGPSGRDWT